MTSNNPFEGFKAGTSFSPAQGNTQDKKRRFQNAMPVTIKQLLECKENTVVVEGVDAQVVTIMGLVVSVKQTQTKCSVTIDDQTGTIECLNYVESDQQANANQPTILCEGAYGRVIGSLKRHKETKYLLILQWFPVTDLNEVNCHILEVIQSQIALKRLRETKEQNANRGTQSDQTLRNSIIKPERSATTETGCPMNIGEGLQGLEPNQILVHRIIASCKDEEGMQKNEIIDAAKNQMSEEETINALQFLAHEGLIFLTIDGDHYTATESLYI